MSKHRPVATQRLFEEYKTHITSIILEEHGPSYATTGEYINSWQQKIPYNKKIEDFIIFKTKMYIHFLGNNNGNSTDPCLLKALTKLMAKYLSGYTVRNPMVQTQEQAIGILQDTLYNQSAYIQSLLNKQMEKRAKRKQNAYKPDNQRKRHTTHRITKQEIIEIIEKKISKSH